MEALGTRLASCSNWREAPETWALGMRSAWQPPLQMCCSCSDVGGRWTESHHIYRDPPSLPAPFYGSQQDDPVCPCGKGCRELLLWLFTLLGCSPKQKNPVFRYWRKEQAWPLSQHVEWENPNSFHGHPEPIKWPQCSLGMSACLEHGYTRKQPP